MAAYFLAVSEQDYQRVADLLGRRPRGLEAVAVADEQGRPQVIRVASLVDEKPFPTLFWLVDPALCYRIDRAEAEGLIAVFQGRVDADQLLRDALDRDHLAYIKLRDQCMSAAVRAGLQSLGFADVLAARGVGGIADFGRIRCLHTWYAAHLVVPNTVGRMLDEHWQNYPG